MLQSKIVKKYDKYKDSGIEWIGEIPQEWTVGNLKRLTDFIKNGTSVTQVENETEYKVSRIETISTGEINYSKTGYVKYFDNIYDYKLNDNDILFSNINSLEMVGNVAIYDNKQPLYSGMNLLRISVNKKTCPKWLFYVLRNSYFVEQVKANAKHAINQVSISVGRLSQIPIIIPTKDEQKKIADYLDKKCGEIDRVVETEKSVIEKLKEYKQSIITESVTKGLDKSVPLKDSGIEWIGNIPQHWEAKRTKYTANSFDKGNGITKEDVVLDGDIQCIRYGEIYSKYDNQCVDCVSATNLDKISTPKHISKGDILFAGTGELIEEIGKNIVYMGDKPCLAGGDIIILKHNQNPIFLNYALNSVYSQSQKSYGKVKLKVVHISASAIGDIRIALPPLEEQEKIAKYLDKKCSEIDKAITDKEQVIEKFTEYKKSLIYECVTGKRKVFKQ